jgi:hypothetical protein
VTGLTGITLQPGETAFLEGDGTDIVRGPASAGINSDITRLRSLEGGTATATAGAATLNSQSGTITTEALTTAAGADYTFTLTNSLISASSRVFWAISQGTNTIGPYVAWDSAPGSGSVVVKVRNLHASSAFNGTLKIRFWLVV